MANNRALFWKLAETEHIKARAFCRRLAANREDGDDLYHDTLVIALTRFEQLRDQAAFRPWLYRIVVNTFKNRVRHPWWRRLVPLTRQLAENTGGADLDALQTARRRLERAFRAISAEDRALITLHEVEGWQIGELAALFGRNAGTVKMRLSRARRKMRQAIVKQFHQPRPEPSGSGAESEDEVCVAVRPSED